MIDPFSAISGALIAGATAATKETASQAIKDSYSALKTLIIDTYKVLSVSRLEQEPSNSAVKHLVEAEIRSHPAITDDVNILQRTADLNEQLLRLPKVQIEGWGLISESIIAGNNITLQRISGLRGGVIAKTMHAEKDITISDIQAGERKLGN
jgi:hypothetical protein